MAFPLQITQIAKATDSNPSDVAKALPGIALSMAFNNMTDPRQIVGVLATVAVECHFKPVTEYGAVAYFKRYEGRKDLGNINPGDGYKFRGRGYIQITGRANYEKYGKLVGADLLSNPDLALDPTVAAKILIAYCKQSGLDVWCVRGNWLRVRKIVNGGTNGLGSFLQYVWTLLDQIYTVT